MKTTQFLAITTLLITVMACSKQDNQAAEFPAANTSVAGKSMEAMPSETEVKPNEMLPNEIKADDMTTVIEQDNSGRKVIFWYDPMLEDRHFSKSGQSPFMDMKLAPQYAEDVDKGGQP